MEPWTERKRCARPGDLLLRSVPSVTASDSTAINVLISRVAPDFNGPICKSPYLAFLLAGRLMGDPGSIVLPLIIIVYHIGQHFFACGTITP
jgi:hypothetical protein